MTLFSSYHGFSAFIVISLSVFRSEDVDHAAARAGFWKNCGLADTPPAHKPAQGGPLGRHDAVVLGELVLAVHELHTPVYNTRKYADAGGTAFGDGETSHDGGGVMKRCASEGSRETIMWSAGLVSAVPIGGVKMAYPEPLPILRGKDARHFLRKLREFQLTPEQKEFWRGAVEDHEAGILRTWGRRIL